MKSSFRPSSPEDLGGLSIFLRRAFDSGADAPFVQPAAMHWKYWDPRRDWLEPRSYLLEREGSIVAHAGLWPMVFGKGGAAVRGVHMIDWASAKEAPGAGLALVQKISALFDFIVAIGGSDQTRKALPAFGFVEYARQWRGALPLRPFRQMATHQSRNWKLLPRMARNFLLSRKRVQPSEDWRSEPLQPEQIAPGLLLQSAPDALFSPREPSFFEYLLRCPTARVLLFGVFKGAVLRGHFVLSAVRGQARVAGVWLISPDRAAFSAAYSLAHQAAHRLNGAFEIVATGTKGESGEGAASAGFTVSDGAPVYLLNKKGKLSLTANFQFQLSDDDEAVLDTGAPNYWT